MCTLCLNFVLVLGLQLPEMARNLTSPLQFNPKLAPFEFVLQLHVRTVVFSGMQLKHKLLS